MTTTDGLPYSLGAVKDEVDTRDFPVARLQPVRLELPRKLDYEAEQSPVKDQGARGACVAFATVAVKEWQEKKQRRYNKEHYDFSDEWVYSQIMLPGGGAYIRDGAKCLNKVGVPRERFMPYDYSKRDHQAPVFDPKGRAKYNATFYKAGVYARLMSLEEMKNSLFLNGPFIYGVDWRGGWFDARNRDAEGYPVLNNDGSYFAGGHAIAIIGYDDDTRTMKFKNSWGTGWGKAGYGKFSYETVETHLLDAWAMFDEHKADRATLKELRANL